MITTIRLRIGVILFCAQAASAQMTPPHQDVTISNQNPKWGEQVTITYDPPKDSPFRSQDYHDTLFFTPQCTGLSGEYQLAIPMQRSESSGKFVANFVVPDSLASFSLNVCTPRKHFLRMVTSVTCLDRNSNQVRGNFYAAALDDSNWTRYRKNFPDDYLPLLTFYAIRLQLFQFGQDTTLTKEKVQALLDTIIARLGKDSSKNLSHELALATLKFQKEKSEHADDIELKIAAQATQYDPFLENSMFWGYFFSPHEPELLMKMPARWRALSPLAMRFPATIFAKEWIDAEAQDSNVDAAVFQKIASTWKNKIDVELWKNIAHGFIHNRALLNSAEALAWAERAEKANRNKAGFYSGADVFSGEAGVLQEILDLKAEALAALHRLPDAVSAAEEAIAMHGYDYNLPEVRTTLGNCYLEAGRLDDAQKMFAMALPAKSTYLPRGIEKLYAACKQNDETQDAFIQRLRVRFPMKKNLQPMQNFSFTTLDGKTGTLADYRGKVVMIDFWFVGCMGCMIERESLDTLAIRFAGDTNVVLLSIAISSADELKNYLAKHPTKFIVVPDASTICDNADIQGFPTHVIIGRDGTTLLRNEGGSAEVHKSLEKKILDAL